MALSERVMCCYGWFKLGAFYCLAGRQQVTPVSTYGYVQLKIRTFHLKLWLCSAEDPHIPFKIVAMFS